VVESQDGVEPLTLLELQQDPGATDAALGIMQKVMGEMQRQSQTNEAKNEELATEAAVNKAELEKRVAIGDNTLKADAQEAEDEKAPVDEKELAPVVQQGLQELDSVQQENIKLREKMQHAESSKEALEEQSFKDNMQKVSYEIKEKYEAKRLANPQAAEFKMIPFFMYKTLAKTVNAPSVELCEKVCAQQRKCKSFTFVSSTHTCFWSVEKLKFHDDYLYAAKVTHPEPGEPDKKWNETPGLMWVTPISKNEYKISFEECKDLCWKEGVGCAAVSYKKNTRTCIRGSEALPTDEHAKYYEKLDSDLDVQEGDQIRKAQNKLETVYKAKETALKAKDKEEEERNVRETTEKKSAREVYTKQMPKPDEERKMKQQVEKQVADVKLKLEEEKVTEQQQKELKRTALLEKKQATRMAKLQKLHKYHEVLDTRVDERHKKLLKQAVVMKSVEETATEATDKLNEKLELVQEDHKNAMQALATWQETHGKEDADPAAVAAARIAMQESHTKLSTSIHEAEFEHGKEVHFKKELQSASMTEAKDSRYYTRAEASRDKRKRKDGVFILQVKKAEAQEQDEAARRKYDVHKGAFDNLKAKEVEAKKVQATDQARQTVLDDQIKNAEKPTTKTDLVPKFKEAKEANAKAKAGLQELNVQFKEQLKTVTFAKENYEKRHHADLSKAKKDEQKNAEGTLLVATQAANAALAGPATVEL
jgi:hypothetical protein